MRLRNIILFLVVVGSLFSCYEDLGNYEYHDINEITVKGIEENYALDVFDTLRIKPELEATMYSDTSKFTYKWEMVNSIIGESHDLEVELKTTPGSKVCRYIITDKETGVKKYHKFNLRVSSSTAGDLIMILSKYNSIAELSYLRLDKPSNFTVNYYQERFGAILGVNPQQLFIEYCESAGGPFCNYYGKVMVLADDEVKLIDKNTLNPDSVNIALSGESYLKTVSYPKPDIEGYKSQFIVEEGFYIWRKSAYGSGNQLQTQFTEISGGALYYTSPSNLWTQSYSTKGESPYNGGSFSPYAFYDDMSETPHNNLRQAGYSCGNLMVFDYTNGRFAYANSGAAKEIKLDQLKAFPGYKLQYGTATSIADNTTFSVLTNGGTSKLLLLSRKIVNKVETYSISAEMTCNSTIDATTKLFCIKKLPYIFYITGDKLYRYNLLNISTGAQPNENNIVCKLSDLGYDASAKFTSIFISRSERTILLGVSRYGGDNEALGEEAKGDLLYFDLNNSNLEVKYNKEKSYKGISGIPVDIKIKYQTHRRNGLDYDDKLVDNI